MAATAVVQVALAAPDHGYHHDDHHDKFFLTNAATANYIPGQNQYAVNAYDNLHPQQASSDYESFELPDLYVKVEPTEEAASAPAYDAPGYAPDLASLGFGGNFTGIGLPLLKLPFLKPFLKKGLLKTAIFKPFLKIIGYKKLIKTLDVLIKANFVPGLQESAADPGQTPQGLNSIEFQQTFQQSTGH